MTGGVYHVPLENYNVFLGKYISAFSKNQGLYLTTLNVLHFLIKIYHKMTTSTGILTWVLHVITKKITSHTHTDFTMGGGYSIISHLTLADKPV